MIFLTALDAHAEPSPLAQRAEPRRVPTITEACGFGPRDYVPDPMAAPLGSLDYLCPEGAAPPWTPETPALLDHLAETADLPPSWRDGHALAAMGQFIANDVAAPCDRVPGLSQPQSRDSPPLGRDHAARRLGNLRSGTPELHSVLGGACLQGSIAVKARHALQSDAEPGRLRHDAVADLRNTAHPDLLDITRILVEAHNRSAGRPDGPARLLGAWRHFLLARARPALCGFTSADAGAGRPGALPLESLFGPMALLPLALHGRTRAPASVLKPLLLKCARLNLPSAGAVLDGLDPGHAVPRLGAGDLPEGLDPARCPLPIYLLAEARAAGNGLFGPLGRILLDAGLFSALAHTGEGAADALYELDHFLG